MSSSLLFDSPDQEWPYADCIRTKLRIDSRIDSRTSESPILRGLSERDIKQSCILIVDDESLNIEVVRRYLEFGGYKNLISTDHAGQALAADWAEPPDVVLLDIQMPEINGLEILAAIRSDEALVQNSRDYPDRQFGPGNQIDRTAGGCD